MGDEDARPTVAAVSDDEGDEDDEGMPLLKKVQQARRKAPPLSYPILWVVGLGAVHAVMVRLDSALTFPYLRTLQRCGGVLPHDAAVGWSGSDLCQDRDLVSREAQALTGYVQCLGLLAHSVCLPALGWVGDRFGRKLLIILYFIGLAVACAMNAVAGSIPVFFAATAVHHASNGLTPALLAMIADELPPSDRMPAYWLYAITVVPAAAFTYLSVTHYVLARHLHSYEVLWSSLACLAALCGVVSCVCPETLQRPSSGTADEEHASWDRTKGNRVRYCAPVRVLSCCCARPHADEQGSRGGAPWSVLAPYASPSLRFIMMVEAPAVVGLAAFNTLDGFALIAYAWEQEAMYYARLAALPSAALSLVGSSWMLRNLGARGTLQFALACLSAALVIMCFAQWHVMLLYLSLAFAGGFALVVFPILRLLSAQAEPSQQAGATAAIISVAHGAKAVGIALQSYLFENGAMRGLLFAPYALGSVGAIGALLVALTCSPPEHAFTPPRTPDPGKEAHPERSRDS